MNLSCSWEEGAELELPCSSLPSSVQESKLRFSLVAVRLRAVSFSACIKEVHSSF